MTDLELLQAIANVIKEEVATVIRGEVGTIVKEEVAPIHIQIENEILPAIQKLAEGQQSILEHIDQKIEDRTENLQGQIDVLNAVVKQHSQDIRELKMAQ